MSSGRNSIRDHTCAERGATILNGREAGTSSRACGGAGAARIGGRRNRPDDLRVLRCVKRGLRLGGTRGDTQTFDFVDYKYILTFLDGTDPFFITINDVPLSQTTFDSREVLPGTYDCVPLVDPGGTTTPSDPCRDFVITDSSGGAAWTGYRFTIAWLFGTDGTFPNGTDPPGPVPGQVRVLQNPGSVPGLDYTIDMCLTFTTPGCTYFSGFFDPALSSGDTDFSSMTVAWTSAAVPEPGMLILMGTGLGGLLYRRRRRRRDTEPPSTVWPLR